MTSNTVFRYAAAVMATVGSLKYTHLLVESGFRLEYSPWGFLLVFVLPFAVVVCIASRWPRSAAVLMIVAAVPTLVFLGVGLVQVGFVLEGWSDPLVAYLGTPAVAVGLVAAVRSLVRRRVAAAH